MEKITGKNNEIIKGIKKLFSSSGNRRAQSLFVLEGARLVFDVLNSFFEVKYFLITQNSYDRYTEKAELMIERSEKSFLISEDISQRLSETQSSQGVFAVCKMKENTLELKPSGKYIALDNVQDPGNFGTIIRTAEALGINSVIAFGGCDAYNPKALRASMGSILRIPFVQGNDPEAFFKSAKENGLKLYATVPGDTAKEITKIDFSQGAVCVIGNEANGVSAPVKSLCDECITIPMLGRAESLNACTAAAITMWEMLR